MKLLTVLVAVTALCAGSAIPSIPGDNSHYVEGESRYVWVPDGEGVPHLVDLYEQPDEESFQTRNGANNIYWLYTRENRNGELLIDGDIDSVRNSNYDGNRHLVVLVHGWNGIRESRSNMLPLSAFLDTQDVNVIVLDWSDSASGLYTGAIRTVPSVGQFLGNFLAWLINNAGGNWEHVHMIGFSLGAQVIGSAGRAVGGQISRVTGLDPAGPLWHTNVNSLNRTDGVYVEGIHTDGGLLGIFTPVGHADFYPDGGRHPQPGCVISTCSHDRAFELFASTIRNDNIDGLQCSDLSEVGNPSLCTGPTLRMGNGNVSKRGSGIYAVIPPRV